jgi:anti-sigma regulatory factor (Ser/Thr protein kinase)
MAERLRERYRVARDLDEVGPGEVRELVRSLLASPRGDLVDDAVLLTDELVTNAIRHGNAPRTCQLLVTDSGTRLRVEVTDHATAAPRFRRPDATGGRGLVLIDHLAARWGVERHGNGKTVWAELSMDNAQGERLVGSVRGCAVQR